MTTIDLDGLVTISEAGELSGYTHDYLRRLARQGDITAQQIAGRWLFDRDALLEYRRKMADLGKRKHGRKATRASDDQGVEVSE